MTFTYASCLCAGLMTNYIRYVGILIILAFMKIRKLVWF